MLRLHSIWMSATTSHTALAVHPEIQIVCNPHIRKHLLSWSSTLELEFIMGLSTKLTWLACLALFNQHVAAQVVNNAAVPLSAAYQGFSYAGCYTDPGNDKAVGYNPAPITGDMTIEKCIDGCRLAATGQAGAAGTAGYHWAGIAYSGDVSSDLMFG